MIKHHAAPIFILTVFAGTASAGDGQSLFRQNCTGCHSLKSEKIRAQIPPGADLGGIGKRLDAAALRAIVLGENQDGHRHKPFKGSERDLGALVDWLARLE